MEIKQQIRKTNELRLKPIKMYVKASETNGKTTKVDIQTPTIGRKSNEVDRKNDEY